MGKQKPFVSQNNISKTSNVEKEKIEKYKEKKKRKRIVNSLDSSSEDTEKESEKCDQEKRKKKKRRKIAIKPAGDSESTDNGGYDLYPEPIQRRKKKKEKEHTSIAHYYSQTVKSINHKKKIPPLIIKK